LWHWTSYLHLHVSVAKQYNLVPAKLGNDALRLGRYPQAWWKVMTT